MVSCPPPPFLQPNIFKKVTKKCLLITPPPLRICSVGLTKNDKMRRNCTMEYKISEHYAVRNFKCFRVHSGCKSHNFEKISSETVFPCRGIAHMYKYINGKVVQHSSSDTDQT